MKIRNGVAYNIWQVRQEVGLEGTADDDWYLAGRFLDEHDCDDFDYDDIYMWVMENWRGYKGE